MGKECLNERVYRGAIAWGWGPIRKRGVGCSGLGKEGGDKGGGKKLSYKRIAFHDILAGASRGAVGKRNGERPARGGRGQVTTEA